ncbi:hypothetical protein DFA_12023 [Cavenderia fasciculata]|uniref:Ankyrin repeat-containing protein n=1 Tax=Cavenderia fasciculata TaxID=261658 RepID=F4QFF2_CACFS|nr:uncharacterized protein DFA_12023 [Cavenderia fasciculata]EGG14253.1 hypothetical protein DFA_12023 [Cavenderia fasciculata]|eukprot:XP_004350962.1 hypothetical protein DFA_12023 [Cavenderia fasciculata]
MNSISYQLQLVQLEQLEQSSHVKNTDLFFTIFRNIFTRSLLWRMIQKDLHQSGWTRGSKLRTASLKTLAIHGLEDQFLQQWETMQVGRSHHLISRTGRMADLIYTAMTSNMWRVVKKLAIYHLKAVKIRIIAQKGNLDMVKFMVENGFAKMNGGPLFSAMENGHLEVVEYLFGVNPYRRNKFWYEATCKTAANGHLHVIRFLNANGVSEAFRPPRHKSKDWLFAGDLLSRSIDSNNVELVRYLYTYFYKDNQKYTCHSLITKAMDSGNIDIVNYIRENIPLDHTITTFGRIHKDLIDRHDLIQSIVATNRIAMITLIFSLIASSRMEDDEIKLGQQIRSLLTLYKESNPFYLNDGGGKFEIKGLLEKCLFYNKLTLFSEFVKDEGYILEDQSNGPALISKRQFQAFKLLVTFLPLTTDIHFTSAFAIAQSSNLEMVKWMVQNRHRFQFNLQSLLIISTCSTTSPGNLEVMAYLYDLYQNQSHLSNIPFINDRSYLPYAYTREKDLLVLTAILHQNEMVKLLLSSGHTYSPSVMDHFAAVGDLEFIKYLCNLGHKCTDKAFANACEKGYLETAKFLYETFEECRTTQASLTSVVSKGHLSIVQYLTSIGTYDQATIEISVGLAIHNNDMPIIRYLLGITPEKWDNKAMKPFYQKAIALMNPSFITLFGQSYFK